MLSHNLPFPLSAIHFHLGNLNQHQIIILARILLVVHIQVVKTCKSLIHLVIKATSIIIAPKILARFQIRKKAI